MITECDTYPNRRIFFTNYNEAENKEFIPLKLLSITQAKNYWGKNCTKWPAHVFFNRRLPPHLLVDSRFQIRSGTEFVSHIIVKCKIMRSLISILKEAGF